MPFGLEEEGTGGRLTQQAWTAPGKLYFLTCIILMHSRDSHDAPRLEAATQGGKPESGTRAPSMDWKASFMERGEPHSLDV